MKFAVSGIRLKEEEISSSEAVRQAFDRIRDGFRMVGKAVTPEPHPEEVESYVEREIASFTNNFLRGHPHAQIVMNLGLVMLCTQFEVFINHLVDIILATEPRRFLDLFPDKEMKVREVVQLGDYPSVMRGFREKVVGEIDRAGTRDKFVRYLGEKFKLISEREIKIVPPPEAQSDRFDGWDLGKLEAIFKQRHRIVHRGELPVADLDYLGDLHLFFTALQTVMAVNAVRKHAIRLDNPTSAVLVSAYGKLFGVDAHCLDQFQERVRAMFPKQA